MSSNSDAKCLPDPLPAYAALSARLAEVGEDDTLKITAADFPDELPEVMAFREIIIDTDFRRFIGSAGPGPDRPYEIMDRTQGFMAYIEPDALRRLGLWMLHLLFSGRDWAGLKLTHPESRAKWLYVQFERPRPPRGFLYGEGEITYNAYEYWSRPVYRHAFAVPSMSGGGRVDEVDRPFFALGWSKADYNWTLPIRDADQIIWDLTPDGLCALSGLFFDMAHPTLGLDEVSMEPPYVGIAATQPRSIEARFWLPGSLGFYADTLDGIRLPQWSEDRVPPPDHAPDPDEG